MNNRTSSFYILIGMLLIITAPILLATQLAKYGRSHSYDYFSEAVAFVSETAHEQDGKYVMQVAFMDSSWSSENDAVSTPTDEDIERVSDSVSGGKSMSDAVSAMSRSKLAENDPTTKEGMHFAELEVDQKEGSQYKEGDSLRILYEPGMISTALIKPVKGKAKNDAGSWLLVCLLLIILGIFMVRTGRRAKKAQAQQDILSHYTTSDFLNKKGPLNKGGRPGL